MLTVMLLVFAGPAMAGDNNRQERREDREEFREDDVLVFGYDFNDCCDIEGELDEEVVLVNDFYSFVPLAFVVEIDVDCDGIDDRLDGWIGNGCVIEDVDIEPLFD
jgi:hypothetical protein